MSGSPSVSQSVRQFDHGGGGDGGALVAHISKARPFLFLFLFLLRLPFLLVRAAAR